MSQYKLSFYIPVYKPEPELLKQVIKSICTQSLKDWEALWIIDDDTARDIGDLISKEMNRYGKTAVISYQKHSGAQKARNKGLKLCRGEYVVAWDSDCVIEPDTAQMWVHQLDKNKDIQFVYSGYRFIGGQGGIASEPFDPWLLKVRNYISTCFPVRKSFLDKHKIKWDESLESLQDWDFWLQVVGKGGVGHYIPGYAFSTALPSPESISGKGCTPENWLKRVNAVKHKHNLAERETCVTSVSRKQEAISLAKQIGADYQAPEELAHKPHDYKKIVQIGYSFQPGVMELCAKAHGGKGVKKFLYWTNEAITELYNGVSVKAVHGDRYNLGYIELLNANCTQFAEDKEAFYLLERLGLKVSVLPMPAKALEEKPLPEKPRFLVETQEKYGEVFNALDFSLPDIELVVLGGKPEQIEDYTGLIHFYDDRSISPSIKGAILAGRHVISNVRAPLCNYVSDKQDPDTFIPQIVDKVRRLAKETPSKALRESFEKGLDAKKLVEALNA